MRRFVSIFLKYQLLAKGLISLAKGDFLFISSEDLGCFESIRTPLKALLGLLDYGCEPSKIF